MLIFESRSLNLSAGSDIPLALERIRSFRSGPGIRSVGAAVGAHEAGVLPIQRLLASTQVRAKCALRSAAIQPAARRMHLRHPWGSANDYRIRAAGRRVAAARALTSSERAATGDGFEPDRSRSRVGARVFGVRALHHQHAVRLRGRRRTRRQSLALSSALPFGLAAGVRSKRGG